MTSNPSVAQRPNPAGPGAQRPARAPRPQVVLDVIATERLNEHFVRLTLGGEGFDRYRENAAAQLEGKPVQHPTDTYAKLLFADPSLGLTPPYDLEELRQRLRPEQMPVRRTYTLHSVDEQARTLQIDFVVHGDDGVAGPWAASAQPGDQVCFAGPGSGYAPNPNVDWHLMAGDESALPAITAALAALPQDAQGIALLEVTDAADELPLQAPDGVEVRWLHRGGPFTPESTVLAQELLETPWRAGHVQVFAHGEREVIKQLRRYFTDVRSLDRRQMSLSAYWAHGRAEDAFQAEKREPIGQIFPES